LDGSNAETGNDERDVKHLKLVIVLCAAVGLLVMSLPIGGGSQLRAIYELDPLEAVVYAAIFVLPLVMGAMALVRPPLLGWQGGVALAGFVLGVVRFRVWDTLPRLGGVGLDTTLVVAAIVVGTLASVMALLRPELPE
jgi:hypothetical protein